MSWNRFLALFVVLLGCCVLADFVCLSPAGAPFPAGLQIDDVQWADGDFGRALYCSGSDADSVPIPDHDAIQLGTGDFTIAVWICPDTLATAKQGEYRRLLGKDRWPADFWTLDIYDDGRVMFAMADAEKHNATTTSAPAIKEKVWQALVIGVDRAKCKTSTYVNGELISERSFPATFTGSLDVAGRPLVISAFRKYVGLVADLRLSKSLWDAAQCKEYYTMNKNRYLSNAYRLRPRQPRLFSPPLPTGDRQSMWDTTQLFQTPATYAVEDEPFNTMAEDPVRPLMYDGLPYEGKPTRVFAWYGAPAGASADQPVPAMVLVHGGGGTAFRKWVKLWNDRGYAAIAMDTCGHLPIPLDSDAKPWPKHAFSGPPGWGDYGNMDKPISDHWGYHAVAAVVLGHSLIRSFPEVDATRIGVTGISWGGYLTCIVAGVDDRFRFAAPVYGCGFLGEGSAWLGRLRGMGNEKAMRLCTLWDPSQYLVYARMPMLFCNGTNDNFFWPPAWMKSSSITKGPVSRYFKPRMPHGHAPAGDPKEITAFADAILKNAQPLPSFSAFSHTDRRIQARVTSPTEIAGAEIIYTTTNTGEWKSRQWLSTPIAISKDAGTNTAAKPAAGANGANVAAGAVGVARVLADGLRFDVTAPADAIAAYLAVTDARGLFVSSPVIFWLD
ncbi:MAG: LamG-like jellyroll fold domain-containing protein [Lentisphaeria bacterium]|jgi:hypothetical protein